MYEGAKLESMLEGLGHKVVFLLDGLLLLVRTVSDGGAVIEKGQPPQGV